MTVMDFLRELAAESPGGEVWTRSARLAVYADRAAKLLEASQPAEADGVERLALRAIKAVTATAKDGAVGLSRIMAITNAAGVPEPYSELMADPKVATIVNEPRTKWAHLFKPGESGCTIPPDGWQCSRERGHEGSCAATPKAPATDAGEVEDAFRAGWDAREMKDSGPSAAGYCDDSYNADLAWSLYDKPLATPPAPNDDLRAENERLRAAV